MLRSFQGYPHPYHSGTIYYAATFDQNGAQAVLWSAMDQLFTAPDQHPERDVADYCLDVIPDTVSSEATMCGMIFEWQLVESMLRRYGNKIRSLASTEIVDDFRLQGFEDWPWGLTGEIQIVGARARQLSDILGKARASATGSYLY